MSEFIEEKSLCQKLVLDLGKLWPLELNRWPEVKSETTTQIGRFVAHSIVSCRLSISVIVWAPERLRKCEHWKVRSGKCEHFAMMTSFHLENIYLGSPNLHLKELLYKPTYPPNFMFLTLTGAEIAGGGRICLPSRARNSQTLSRERAKTTPIVFGTLKYALIWVDLRGCLIGGWVQVAPLASPPWRR